MKIFFSIFAFIFLINSIPKKFTIGNIKTISQNAIPWNSQKDFPSPVFNWSSSSLPLIKNSAFFSKILHEQGLDCLLECLKYLTLESFPSESIVFQFGSFGSKFYIILKGLVSFSLKPLEFITEVPESQFMKEGGKVENILKKRLSLNNSNLLWCFFSFQVMYLEFLIFPLIFL